MRVLVTGAAGFIGSALAHRLCDRGDAVYGFDNLNAYYDPRLKHARLARLMMRESFHWIPGDLESREAVDAAFELSHPEVVVNLAAQVGVRNSVLSPSDYIGTNVSGFVHVLEACKRMPPRHLVYSSSSSVYGSNASVPFSEHEPVDHPRNVYAATKKMNELLAHAYAHLCGLPSTGLRFFTAYGPWGRPDMALFTFADAILEGREIELYGEGNMQRDFTYIDDVVDAVIAVMDRPARANPAWDPRLPDPATSAAPWRVYNVGPNQPVALTRFVELIEKSLGVAARKRLVPMPSADVAVTSADCRDLAADFGIRPTTPLEIGIPKFVEWYRAWRAGELYARPPQVTTQRR